MGVVWGLLCAFSIGASDLFARRLLPVASSLRTAIVLQLGGAVTGLLGVVVIDSVPLGRDLAIAAVSGLFFAIGLVCYYEGLRASSAVVVSPIVAVMSAGGPYLYALGRGDTPSVPAILGAAVAVLGVGLISARDRLIPAADAVAVGHGVRWGLRSGAGYCLGLIVAIEISAESGAWPVVSQRLAAAVLLAGFGVATRRTISLPTAHSPAAVAAGVFVGLSTLFYLLGVQVDAPSAVVASGMFPAVVVVVGRYFYLDRVTLRQVIGLVLALVGVAGAASG